MSLPNILSRCPAKVRILEHVTRIRNRVLEAPLTSHFLSVHSPEDLFFLLFSHFSLTLLIKMLIRFCGNKSFFGLINFGLLCHLAWINIWIFPFVYEKHTVGSFWSWQLSGYRTLGLHIWQLSHSLACGWLIWIFMQSNWLLVPSNSCLDFLTPTHQC